MNLAVQAPIFAYLRGYNRGVFRSVKDCVVPWLALMVVAGCMRLTLVAKSQGLTIFDFFSGDNF